MRCHQVARADPEIFITGPKTAAARPNGGKFAHGEGETGRQAGILHAYFERYGTAVAFFQTQPAGGPVAKRIAGEILHQGGGYQQHTHTQQAIPAGGSDDDDDQPRFRP